MVSANLLTRLLILFNNRLCWRRVSHVSIGSAKMLTWCLILLNFSILVSGVSANLLTRPMILLSFPVLLLARGFPFRLLKLLNLDDLRICQASSAKDGNRAHPALPLMARYSSTDIFANIGMGMATAGAAWAQAQIQIAPASAALSSSAGHSRRLHSATAAVLA